MREWKTCRLGDVSLLITKGTTPRGTYNVEAGPEAVAFVRAENVTGSEIQKEGLRYIKKEIHEHELKRSILQSDDLLITIAGAIGRTAIVPASILPANTNQAVGIVRLDGTKINRRFVLYSLQSPVVQNDLKALSSGQSVQANLNLAQVGDITFPCPSFPTQRRIAAVLGALDDKIELNRKMNANLEAMAQALFKSWFVDFEPFGGQMPAGWKKGVLSDVAEFSPRRVSVAEARGDYFSTDGMKPNRQGAEASSLPEVGSVVSVDVGDVLVSNIRPYFKKIFRAVEPCTCSTDVLCFKPKVKDYGLYLYRTLWSDEFFAYAVAGSKGTKMPRGDKSQMMAYEIAIPDEQMLLKFNSLVDPLCGRIDANAAQSRTLAQLRDTLLPKLMSGELNVDDVKIEDAARTESAPYQDLRLSVSPRENSASGEVVSRGGAETRREEVV